VFVSTTILGTPMDDDLAANNNDVGDVFFGFEGADTLTGGPSDDTIFGGGGADGTIDAGAGDDVIIGGAGDDTSLEGGEGNDRILAGDGDDAIISGMSDNDFIVGGSGDDRALFGRSGQDTINAGPGADTGIDGGLGADTIDVGNDSKTDEIVTSALADFGNNIDQTLDNAETYRNFDGNDEFNMTALVSLSADDGTTSDFDRNDNVMSGDITTQNFDRATVDLTSTTSTIYHDTAQEGNFDTDAGVNP
jgi:Ca2+-binding RTX toxin-like protein